MTVLDSPLVLLQMRSRAIEDIIRFRRYVCLSEEYSKFSKKKRRKVGMEAFLVMISCSDGGHFEHSDGIL